MTEKRCKYCGSIPCYKEFTISADDCNEIFSVDYVLDHYICFDCIKYKMLNGEPL